MTNNTNPEFTIKDYLKSIDERLVRIDTKLDTKADKSLVDNLESRLRTIEQQGSPQGKEALRLAQEIKAKQDEWPADRVADAFRDYNDLKDTVTGLERLKIWVYGLVIGLGINGVLTILQFANVIHKA